jgi:ABC-2 type transport system permease protein
METTRGFHAVMNLFLLPLWFLSGALFPADTTAPVLQTLIALNPVSYAVSGLRHGIYGLADAPATIASPGVCLLVSAGFAAFMVGLATFTVRRALYPSD